MDEVQTAPDLKKTRLCVAWTHGRCNETDCKFAHGQEDLRVTDLCFKKALCKWHEEGTCQNGDRCRFAHGTADLREHDPEVDGILFQDGPGPKRRRLREGAGGQGGGAGKRQQLVSVDGDPSTCPTCGCTIAFSLGITTCPVCEVRSRRVSAPYPQY